jgi:hypothetical protein
MPVNGRYHWRRLQLEGIVNISYHVELPAWVIYLPEDVVRIVDIPGRVTGR